MEHSMSGFSLESKIPSGHGSAVEAVNGGTNQLAGNSTMRIIPAHRRLTCLGLGADLLASAENQKSEVCRSRNHRRVGHKPELRRVLRIHLGR